MRLCLDFVVGRYRVLLMDANRGDDAVEAVKELTPRQIVSVDINHLCDDVCGFGTDVEGEEGDGCGGLVLFGEEEIVKHDPGGMIRNVEDEARFIAERMMLLEWYILIELEMLR